MKIRIIAAIIFLIVLTISAYILIVVIPSRLAERSYSGAQKIARDIRNALQFSPEVIVNNTVILGQQEEILQLSLVSQRFRHEYQWTNTWMGSTKKIFITGSFDAKAGFDLDQKFSMDVREDKVIIMLPHAELLSVTPKHDLAFRDENGVWNWVNAIDKSNAINAFTRDAQKFAANARFIKDAETELEKRLTSIVGQHGKTVEFRYHETLEEKK